MAPRRISPQSLKRMDWAAPDCHIFAVMVEAHNLGLTVPEISDALGLGEKYVQARLTAWDLACGTAIVESAAAKRKLVKSSRSATKH